MTHEWLAALLVRHEPTILVTVARAEGSAPREAGAKMLVGRDAQFDTIGGGHLEWCAVRFARDMLASHSEGRVRRLERFALGPTLGQCCGGVVWLAFERIEPADHGLYRAIRQCLERGEDCWRVCSSDSGKASALLDASGRALIGDANTVDTVASPPGCHVEHAEHGAWTLIDWISARMPHLFLFGAGHVGAAVVRAVSALPCRITWVDEREDLFPASLPPNVRTEATDTPEAVVDAAPADASFLVMTHSHALDQRLAECILRRERVAWFGLIGSHTKRIQFERRLAARGIAPDRIAHMICPVGLPGIRGKQPAVIAASIAAQLLQAWEQQRCAVQPGQTAITHRRHA